MMICTADFNDLFPHLAAPGNDERPEDGPPPLPQQQVLETWLALAMFPALAAWTMARPADSVQAR